MMYAYIKALHIIFVVTWFAGLFYLPRLFIYYVEAETIANTEAKAILQKQLQLMSKRLWYGITWPSAVITLVMGLWVMVQGGWHTQIMESSGMWLALKLVLVMLLYGYHFSLQLIYKFQSKGITPYTSTQLRVWNEVPTVLLVSIVMLVVVKQSISLLWGTVGIVALIFLLLSAIKIYKYLRTKK